MLIHVLQFNCSLKQLDSPNTKPLCRKDSMGYEAFKELIGNWPSKTEPEIYAATGCMPSCDRKRIKLENLEQGRNSMSI